MKLILQTNAWHIFHAPDRLHGITCDVVEWGAAGLLHMILERWEEVTVDVRLAGLTCVTEGPLPWSSLMNPMLMKV